MPYLLIQTNLELGPDETATLARRASAETATLLGKPERYVMVCVRPGETMCFAGDDAPLAYLELKSIGLPADRTDELSAGLCALVGAALDIPSERIYIEFADAQRHMFGWNGGTF